MGKDENVRAAQEALLARARANSKASLGKYVPGSEGHRADGALDAITYIRERRKGAFNAKQMAYLEAYSTLRKKPQKCRIQ